MTDENRGRKPLNPRSPTTHLHIRVANVEKKQWEAAARALGYEDLSAFVRETLNNRTSRAI